MTTRLRARGSTFTDPYGDEGIYPQQTTLAGDLVDSFSVQYHPYYQRRRRHNTRLAFRQALSSHVADAYSDRIITRLRIWMRKAIKRARQALNVPRALVYGMNQGDVRRYLPYT